MSRGTRGAGALTLVIVVSCTSGPADEWSDPRSQGSAAPAAPTPVPLVREAPGALAARREAQESFDRARAALLREAFAESARELANASAFMRTHAEEAEIGAIAALQGTSKELEMLSGRLARGEPLTVRTLDRVFANANRAEAQHHLTRAVAAMAEGKYPRAGEELIMGVDHLERALRDLRRWPDPEADAALADARLLADLLLRGDVPPRVEAERVTGQIEAELRRLCGIIDVEARACALEAVR